VSTYRLRDVRYWLNRETRVWWAARYDSNGNQIGDAVHAATRDSIIKEIDAHLTPPRATVKCKLCGVSVPLYPSEVGRRVYCGRRCKLAALQDHHNLRGYNKKRQANSEGRNAKVFALRNSGLSLAAIADQVGMTPQGVYGIIKRSAGKVGRQE
jgi:hypothetical protein